MQITRVLPKDAIESIDDPSFSESYAGDSNDEVIVVEPAGEQARAYPVLILNYHEIVNDRIGSDPIAVTWCPLCGSGIVYDRTVDDRVLTFGVSGKLADDDLVMYDRETESEWKQSTGACIAGSHSGTTLDVLPAAMTTIDRFREHHPGLVLEPPSGDHSIVKADEEARSISAETTRIDYTVDHFAEYVEGDWLGSRSREQPRAWDRDDLPAKEVVLGIEIGDEALGIPHSHVGTNDVVSLTVGTQSVVVLEADGHLSAFIDPGVSFTLEGNGRYAGDGTNWDGATGHADDGRSLERLPTRRMFAFAWQADHGEDAFYMNTTDSE